MGDRFRGRAGPGQIRSRLKRVAPAKSVVGRYRSLSGYNMIKVIDKKAAILWPERD